MKTCKVAGTGYPLAGGVPSARDQRSRYLIGNQPSHSLLGGRHTECACYLICLTLLTGCGLDGPVPRGPQHDEPAAASQPSEQKPAVEQKTTPDKAAVAAASPAKSTAAQKPATIREKATVGMGEEGRGYGGDPITAAIKAQWSAKEKITYDQIRHALDVYKADKGEFPKDYQEFKKEILIPGNLKLPPLPEGDSYSYDPIGGELMVEHSK